MYFQLLGGIPELSSRQERMNLRLVYSVRHSDGSVRILSFLSLHKEKCPTPAPRIGLFILTQK